MTAPLLGAWEVDVPKPAKKKTVSCDGCSEVFSLGELRCTWVTFQRGELDAPYRAFHLRCISQASSEGLCCAISGQNTNRMKGLPKAQLAQLRAAQNGSGIEDVKDLPVTPDNKCLAKMEEISSSEKDAVPVALTVTESVDTQQNSGAQVCNTLAPEGKDISKKGAKKKCAEKGGGKPAKKIKTNASDKQQPEEPEEGNADAVPKPQSALQQHGDKHAQGIVPAGAYMPIKDFVRLVKPTGTAREVFEGEVLLALPKVAKWIPWLSREAQKVATSIVQAGNHGALSPQQVYAVVLYTMDVRMGGGQLENNFYYNLNPALQTRSVDVLQGIEGYLHYLIGALEALPKEPEKVYFRGVPKSTFDIVKKNYTSGKRIHWSGISSISDSEKISMGFAMEEGPAEGVDGPGGVVFNITARSGRTIRHLSAIPSESEVLLLPNFRGFVTKSLYRKGKVFRVDILEEAEESAFVF